MLRGPVIRLSAFSRRNTSPLYYRKSNWMFSKTPLSALNEWAQQQRYNTPVITVEERMQGQFYARVAVPELSATFSETTDAATSKDEARQNAALLFLIDHKIWPF